MDSKRRHQLSQNWLADKLHSQYEEWIRPNAQWIGLVFVGILLIALLLTGYSQITEWNKSAAWQQYFSAVYSPSAVAELETVAESSNSAVTNQARLSLAQLLLTEGCDEALTDAVKATASLEKAVAHFENLVNRGTGEAEFQRQTLFGLAQARETLAATRSPSNPDDLVKAAEAYETLTKRWPDEMLGRKAQKRLTALARPETAKFYELAVAKAAKIAEAPAAEEFKIDLDPKKDSFPGGPTEFDPQKALGTSSILGGAFSDAVGETPKKQGAEATPETTSEPVSESPAAPPAPTETPAEPPEK